MTKKWLKGVARALHVPGGVADPDKERVYVQAVDGGIDALDLHAGTRLWSTDAASIPVLGLRGALLAAHPGGEDAVRFEVLSADDGSVLLTSGAAPRLPGGEWHPLRCEAGSKIVRISWLSRVLRGHRKNFEDVPEEIMRRGCLALDLEDGQVSDVADDETEPGPWPEEAEALELMPDARGDARPWRVGKQIVAVAFDRDRPETALRLHRWDEQGQSHRSKILLRSVPEPGYLERHRTFDEGHVYLLRCNDRKERGLAPGKLCKWIVFAVPSGRRVLTLPLSPGVGPPMTVLGDRLLYAWSGGRLGKRDPHAREIRAADLATGGTVWSHPLRGLRSALNV